MPLHDVQNGPAGVDMRIDRVGVTDLTRPLVVRDKSRGRQSTVARVDMSVDLPGTHKGTHMSRFVEALAQWPGELDLPALRGLLVDVRDRLDATSSHVRFTFPYFLEQTSPASGARGLMDYTCTVDGELSKGRVRITLGAEVPVMTVCPCSLAICESAAAHSQRAVVRVRARFKGMLWLEELIAVAEASGSARVHDLLKREDERALTLEAFANPRFVEDVVRACARRLDDMDQVTWFRVEVESAESIHNHSAFASIENGDAWA
jgi:GTP cyclohydrolase I